MKKFSVAQTTTNMISFLKVLFVSLTLLTSALSVSVYGQSTELIFAKPTLVSGTQGKDGAIYRFKNVCENTDALVTIKGRSSTNVELDNIDVDYYGWDKAFQPRLGWKGGSICGKAKWWMEFKIDFVKPGSTIASDVKEFDVSMLDVDGDGCQIREFYQIGNASSHTLESPTELTFSRISEVLAEFVGPVKNYKDIDTTATTIMFNSKYKNKSSISFKVGAESIGNGTTNSAMRYNSMWFRAFNFNKANLLPVSIINWAATATNNMVNLKWCTTNEKNSSHFIIERSFDGSEFSEMAMLIAAGNSDVMLNYEFNDNLPQGNNGIIYYRFKSVDLDGASKYSDIRIVRLGKIQDAVSISTYPNPAVNEVRVTIPNNWQSKSIAYQIVTANGQIVKSVNVQSASQIQTIGMNEVPAGMYIIRVVNGNEVAVQQVLKAK